MWTGREGLKGLSQNFVPILRDVHFHIDKLNVIVTFLVRSGFSENLCGALLRKNVTRKSYPRPQRLSFSEIN